MKLAIASLSLLLVACNAPQPSSEPSPQPEAAEPAATSAPPVAEAPMAKRAPGQENADPLQIFRAFGTEPFWNVNVEDATLTYTESGYTITADTGDFTLTGVDVTLTYTASSSSVVTVGSWTPSGTDLLVFEAGGEFRLTVSGPSVDAPRVRAVLKFALPQP